MKLLDWMRREGVDDDEMARRVGDCTGYAVKKWKYGERQPPADRILRIEELTKNEVTLRDFVDAPPLAPGAPGEKASAA